jgi:hypothetical protein
MSSPSSTPLSTPSACLSNPESVAQVLSTRGFDWRRVKLQDVQSKSSDVSFKTEWEKFASVVKSIANDVSNDHESEESKEETEQQPNEPEETPNEPVEVVITNQQQSAERTEDPLDAYVAWTNHFMNIITNERLLYDKEKVFENALFDALRNSLGAYVHPISSNAGAGNLIVLRSKSSVKVGFGKEVKREKLGFNNEYALSRSSQPDHGCFVFGTNATKRDFPGADETHESFCDLTAIVELKLEKTSCKPFVIDEGIIKEPDFEKDHAPMGQAMLYSMDMWHCLA